MIFDKSDKLIGNISAINNVINSGTTVDGNIIFSDGSIKILGIVHGDVIGDEKSSVIVCEYGIVNGDISADIVIIDGRVKGNIEARKSLLIKSKSSIDGNISYSLIAIEAGAKINGEMKKI